MRNPVPLNELVGHHMGQAKNDPYIRRDRPYPPDMDIQTAQAEKASIEMNSGPHLFHISILVPMSEVRAWTDQGYVSFEKDVMAHSPDDAIRQIAIHVNRK